MALRKLRNASDRSNASALSMSTGNPDVEYFWACELNAEKRSFEWSVPDLEDGDEDYVEHSLFIRSICLGAGSVEKEENIVAMESVGDDGEMNKGTIANLTKGVNAMSNLSFTVDGKSGVKFTLVEGSGPISICGNHLLDCPKDDDFDMSQTGESKLDDSEDVEGEDEEDEMDENEEEEEEEEKVKSKGQAAKRKAPAKANKPQKQKAKMVVEEDDDEEDDDEDEEDLDDEEDDESDSDTKPKKGKKDAGKKVVANGKAKPVPAAKKAAKKVGKK